MLGSISFGQQPDNVQMMSGLYQKLSDYITLGHNSPVAGNTYFMLAAPGIILDPSRNPVDNPSDNYIVSQLLDSIPTPSWITQPQSEAAAFKFGTFTVDNLLTAGAIYEHIVDFKELPKIKRSDADEANLIAIKDQLYDSNGEPKGKYALYNTLLAAYNKADLAVTKAVQDKRPDSEIIDAKNLRQAAQDRLDSVRSDVETLLEKQSILENKLPDAWWLRVKRELSAAQITSALAKFYPVTPDIAYQVWFQTNTSWHGITMTSSDIERTTYNSSTHIGGSGGLNFGFWSVGAGGTFDRDTGRQDISVKNATIQIEVIRVQLYRPWLNGLILQSRNWRMGSGSQFSEDISDGGDPSRGVPPKGIMPMIPTEVLLARNVTVSGEWSKDVSSFCNTHFQENHSVGWGPFTFGGNYENRTSSSYYHGQAVGNKIISPGVQIIGFYCKVLGKMPNPDPNLNWETPAK